MKIAVVYFEQELPKNRSNHAVTGFMLECWQKHYQLSGTKSIPVLLLDRNTKKPNFWQYESVVVKNDNPQNCKDVLNKVGWIKHQAYDLLGKCIVMDIDALLKQSIDDLFFIREPIAMAPDDGTYREWHWYKDWENAKYKYNAGVIYMNSSEIGKRFRDLWNEKIKYSDITFYDEIIFSSILKEFEGKVLDVSYNYNYNCNCNCNCKKKFEKNIKVMHFSGSDRKKYLQNYLKNSVQSRNFI